MPPTVTGQKVSDALPEMQKILGERWTSCLIGDQIWFVSLNSINQPTYRTYHDTPLFGGAVVAFDVAERSWRKEIIYQTLSCEENMEGRVFSFRNTLLLLCYKRHEDFTFERLYYWDDGKDSWQGVSLYVDPKTDISKAEDVDLVCMVESHDSMYLLTHDRQRGSIMFAQLDTVGGYGKPGPAHIGYLFDVHQHALKGPTASVCGATILDNKVWTLFFGDDDAAGAGARLLTTKLRNGDSEEIDLVGSSGALAKPFKENAGRGKVMCYGYCNGACPVVHDTSRAVFSNALFGSHWLMIGLDDAGNMELWTLDLKDGRWRLLAADERRSDSDKVSVPCIAIPREMKIVGWRDIDALFYGVNFDAGVYGFDVKVLVKDF